MNINYIENKLHLSYCSNFCIANSLCDIFFNLQRYSLLKNKMNYIGSMAIGFWISKKLSNILLLNKNLLLFKYWLNLFKFYIVTLNGFPYGKFHYNYIKNDVYLPDWSNCERKDYTIQLIYILSNLLSYGVEGTISTSPLGYKYYKYNRNICDFYKCIVKNIMDVLIYLINIYKNTGKFISLNIEPEPGCFLENSNDIICFFNNWLFLFGVDYLVKKTKVSKNICEYYIVKYIKICYDVCHFSLYYETFIDVFNKFRKYGISIGKIQLSSCLKLNLLNYKIDYLFDYLFLFYKSLYLHQSTIITYNKQIIYFNDLYNIFNNYMYILKNANEFRIHYHFPIFLNNFLIFDLLNNDIKEILSYLNKNNININHLEIETYTLTLLSQYFNINIIDIIIKEYKFVLNNLKSS